jgi:nicotinate-nucleotide adenylyltransferase
MKIALFFGSFNPIHIGHLALANYVVEFTEYRQLWFVVSPHNPLKKKAGLLDDYLRLDLINEAIKDFDSFKASNIEFGMPQPSYTIHTLAALSEKYPQHEFALLIGEDNLNSFHKWKNYERILESYKILVYPRIDSNINTNIATHPAIVKLKAPIIELSSTMIRDAIKSGKDVRYFLPEKIFQKIDKEGYYRS